MSNPVNATTTRKIGKLTYVVAASSSENAMDTIEKKIEKLIIKGLRQKPATSGFKANFS